MQVAPEGGATKRGGARPAKEVILEYYRRYNSGDVDGVMELMAPDCQCECSGSLTCASAN